MLTHGGCYSVQTAKEEALVIREARALIHHYHVSGNATWDARVIQWEDDARPYLPQPSPAPTQAPRKE
jgi:hypothetical protein